MTNPSGFLPYGSTHPSVILQHPLTSNPLAYLQSKGTVTQYGTPTFNAEGMSTNVTGGFLLAGMAGRTDLDFGYDVTYEVKSEWLAANNAGIASVGYVPPGAAQQSCISASAAVGPTFRAYLKDISGASSSVVLSVSSGSGFNVNSQGKGEYTKISHGFIGGKSGGRVITAMDDCVYFDKVANAPTISDIFANFYIGSDRNTVNTYCARPFRNLQISTRSPRINVHPALRSIGILSDSMFNSDTLISTYADALTSWSMRREFAKHGLYAGTVTFNSTGGAAYSNAAATYLFNTLAAVLASNPSVLIIRGGTNDASQSLTADADWETQVMLYIDTAFANPFVKMIVLPDVPPLLGDGTKGYSLTFVQLANTRLRNVAATWRAANPTSPKKVIVVDIYNAVGGVNPPSGTYIGQVNGLNNDLHFTSGGHYLHGRAIGKAIISELGDL